MSYFPTEFIIIIITIKKSNNNNNNLFLTSDIQDRNPFLFWPSFHQIVLQFLVSSFLFFQLLSTMLAIAIPPHPYNDSLHLQSCQLGLERSIIYIYPRPRRPPSVSTPAWPFPIRKRHRFYLNLVIGLQYLFLSSPICLSFSLTTPQHTSNFTVDSITPS